MMRIRTLRVVPSRNRAHTGKASVVLFAQEPRYSHSAQELRSLKDQVGSVKFPINEWHVRRHMIKEDLEKLVDLLPR